MITYFKEKCFNCYNLFCLNMKTLNYLSISSLSKSGYLLIVFELSLSKFDLIVNNDRVLSISIQDLNLFIKIRNNSIMQRIRIIIVSTANIKLIHLINAFNIFFELVLVFRQVHFGIALHLISKTFIFALHLSIDFFLKYLLRIWVLSMNFFQVLVESLVLYRFFHLCFNLI